MKKILTILILSLSFVVYSQRQTVKEKDGEYVHWYTLNENGDTLDVAHYKNGKKCGEWVIKDENSTIRVKGNYLDDKKIGKWYQYDTNGELITIKEF